MAFYKYREPSENHIKALENNELWFARADTFNDPFDAHPPLNIISYKSMAKLLRGREKAFLLDDTQFDKIVSKELNIANQLIKEGRLEEHPIYPYFIYMAEKVARRFIFSLSQSNTNVLMWSHYSQSHTGFCIRYNLNVLLNEIDISHHEAVNYSNDLPDLLAAMIDDKNVDLSNEIILLKSRDWGYEKEYRLLLDDFSNDKDDKCRSVTHSDAAIERIYFGINTEESLKENLQDILSSKQVEFFQMERAKSSIAVYPFEL